MKKKIIEQAYYGYRYEVIYDFLILPIQFLNVNTEEAE
jgi:hypothetical protein